MRRAMKFSGAACLAVSAVMLAFLAIPGLAGLRAYRVATQSMEPGIPAGSTAYVADLDEPACAGDVIAFENTDGDMVLHRVMGSYDGMLVTKGDANLIPDPSLVRQQDVSGRFVFALPDAGIVFGACAALACMGVSFLVIGRTYRKKPT